MIPQSPALVKGAHCAIIEPISKSVILKLALADFEAFSLPQKPYKTAIFKVAISKFDILKSPQLI
jgi:hypothetical protein